MKLVILVCISLISSSSFAMTVPWDCFNSANERVIHLEVVGTKIFTGEVLNHGILKEEKQVANGIIYAETNSIGVLFVGRRMTYATLLGDNGEIVEQLKCKYGSHSNL